MTKRAAPPGSVASNSSSSRFFSMARASGESMLIQPGLRVGLVRADDAIALAVAAGDVLDLDACAEEHRFADRWATVSTTRSDWQALAQVAHATVDLAELLLAIGVLGVLGAIAFGGGGGQRLDHLRAPDAPELVELGLEPVVAYRA